MKIISLNGILLFLLFMNYLSAQSGPAILKDIPSIRADSSVAAYSYRQAETFLNKANYDSALFFFEKASRLFEKSDDINRATNCNIEIGKIYMRSANYSQASKKLQAALNRALSYSGASKKILSELYNTLGTVNKKLSNLDQALTFYRRALALHSEEYGQKDTKSGELYYNIANTVLHMRSIDKAQTYFQQAMRIFRLTKGRNSIEYGKSQVGFGNLLLAAGKYPQAIAAYDSSISILSKFKNRQVKVAIANNYNNIGIALWYQGYLDKALKKHFIALQMRKNLFQSDHPQIAISYMNMAIVYDEMEQYEKAKTYYKKALIIFLNTYGNEHPYVAQVYNNLGALLLAEGDYANAIEYFKKDIAASIVLAGKDNPVLAGDYLNIAAAYIRLKNWDAAFNYCQKAGKLKSIEKHKDHPFWIKINQNLGNLYLQQKKYKKALNYYKKALKNLKGRDISLKLKTNILTNIGSVYSEMGDLVKAKSIFKEALQIYFKKPEQNKFKISGIYFTLGKLLQNKKDFSAALNYYKKALEFLMPERSSCDFCEQLRVNSSAVSLAAIPVLSEISKIIQQPVFSPKKDCSFWVFKNISDLIDNLRSNYKNKESILFMEKRVSEIYENAIKSMISHHKAKQNKRFKEAAFFFCEKNKSNLLKKTLQDSYAQHFVGIPDSLLERLNNLKADVACYQTALGKEAIRTNNSDNGKLAYFENNLFNAKRKYDQLIERMESDFPLYYQLKYDDRTILVSELQKVLDNKSVLLEYFLSDSAIYVFVISAESYHIVCVDIKTDIRADIQRLTRSVRKYDKGAYLKYSYRIYQTLIQPIEKEIKGKDNLIIIPDGILYYLPFGILLSEKPSQKDQNDFSRLSYLLKKYRVSYHYSATLFAQSARQKTKADLQKGLVAFAPLFDEKDTGSILATRSRVFADTTLRSVLTDKQRFRPLTYSEGEVRSIAALFRKHKRPARLYLREKANEMNFKRYSSGFKFVHLATHGLINENYPKLSGLVFYQQGDSSDADDGILYSAESYALQTSPDLLVLSSCESGVGKLAKGEGLMALTRGFFYAGARNIVVSLWKVSDRQTARLMKKFYSNILDGNSYSSSLRKAKLALIGDRISAFPRYWAGFVLLGQ